MTIKQGLTLLTTIWAIALFAGCENEATSNSKSAQAKLSDISQRHAELSANSSIRSDHSEDRARAAKLRSLAGEAGQVDPMGKDQQSTGSLMQSWLSINAAEAEMRAINKLELRRMRIMSSVNEMLDCLGRLDTLHQSTSEQVFQQEQRLVESTFASAQDGLRNLNDQVRNQQSPIEQMESQNQSQKVMVRQLQDEAKQLQQQANDSGPRHGYPFVEEASKVKIQAKKLESEISNRDIELSQLRPDLAFVRAELASTEALAQNMSDAIDRLKQRGDDRQGQMQAINELKKEFETELDQLMDTLVKERSEVLEPMYQAASSDLNNAQKASLGISSGNSTARDTSNLIKVAIHRAEGELEWARSNGLAAKAIVLKRIAAEGDMLGGSDRWKVDLETTATEQKKAHDKAIAEFTNAQQSAAQISNSTPGIDGIRQAIDGSLAILNGAEAIDTDIQAPTSQPAQATGGSGFDSLDAFATFISTNMPSTESLDRLGQAIRARTAKGQSAKGIFIATLGAQAACYSAIEEHFGAQAVKVANMSDDSNLYIMKPAKIIDQTDSTASLMDKENGQAMPLIKVNGQWYLDMDSFSETMLKAAASLPAGFADQFSEVIVQAGNQEASAIKDGKYPTVQAAVESCSESVFANAMQTLMQQMMQQPPPA